MPATTDTPTPTYDQARLEKLIRRVAFRWAHNGIRYDFIDDLRQECWAYQVEHGTEQWFLRDVRRHMDNTCAQWLWQTKRAANRGLQVLTKGEIDEAWLNQHAPAVEGQALARVRVQRLWQQLTPGEKKAVECLLLADTNERGQICGADLKDFGIPSRGALHTRLKSLRQRVQV